MDFQQPTYYLSISYMSSYGKAPKGTHRMPDGTLMTGSKHSKSSKPVKEEIEFKEGTLRKMLRVPKDMKLTVPVLKKINKNEVGKEFTYNGKKFKMTPLMKKRVTLGINLQK